MKKRLVLLPILCLVCSIQAHQMLVPLDQALVDYERLVLDGIIRICHMYTRSDFSFFDKLPWLQDPYMRNNKFQCHYRPFGASDFPVRLKEVSFEDARKDHPDLVGRWVKDVCGKYVTNAKDSSYMSDNTFICIHEQPDA
jgi:hypothetical protein